MPHTAEVRDGRRTISLTVCIWRGEDTIRVCVSPNIKFKPYGTGFVLR